MNPLRIDIGITAWTPSGASNLAVPCSGLAS